MTTLLFIALSIMQAGASNNFQEKKISVSLKQVTIKEVLEEIEYQSGLKFLYLNEEIDVYRKVEVVLSKVSPKEVLDKIFENSDITYVEKGNQVVLKKKSIKRIDGKSISAPGQEQVMLLEKLQNQTYQQITTALYAKDVIVKGKVVSQEDNQPIPGVNIIIKGTTLGATSDMDGNYEIKVPNENSILVFSFIGYTSEEVLVNGRTTINIGLVSDITHLSEVVVVGYGTQKKYSIVGSITTIEPQKLQAGTTRSLSNNLAGQLAGVIAVQRSGEPGYDNSNFWIRGISTFGGNRDPLVLVDGVERSLNNMDPAEIESFSILKDASASAVYGVRGANGVILINTKRGKVGAPKVNVRFEQGFTTPVKIPEFLGAAEYLEVLNSIAGESGKTLPYSQERIDNIRNKSDNDLYPDVDWLDAITKDQASNSRLNLTVSGGTDMLRYSLVGSYYNESGIIARDPNQEWDSSIKLQRYNIRSNVDLNVTPTTTARVNIGGYLQDDNRPPQSIDDLFNLSFETPPFIHPPQYSTGEIPVTPERANPWARATQTGYVRGSSSKLESLFSVEQDLKAFTPGLKAKVNFSFDHFSGNSVRRTKDPDYYNPAVGRNEEGLLDLVIYRYGQDFLGYEKKSDWGNKSIYLEGNVAYTRDFNHHYVDAMLLYNQRSYDDGSELPFRNQGIAGRFSYSYDYRYIAEFNFGYNGSENFAEGQRYGFFPSVAIGWLMSEEEFMKPYNNTFSKIKFRGSHGLVGNDQIGGRRFAYITNIGNTDGYTWGVNNDYFRAGRREGDYGVHDLTWETVAKSNVGVELGLWNSIELQVDLFKEQRSDIFMQRKTVPGSAGFINTPWANYGKVDNRGVDISMNISKQYANGLFLSARGTFTYAANEIIEQDEASAIVGTSRSSTGKPVGQLFGLIAEGLFTDADFEDVETGTLLETLPRHTYGPVRPGDIRYRDLNTDGKIDDLDRTAIGKTEDPQIVYGFGVNTRFKSIDFGFFFQGNANTNRIIGGSYFIPGTGSGALGNFYTNVNDRWTVENPRQDVFWPRLSDYHHSNNNQESTWWLRDMSMLRLKNVEIGYNFPLQLIDKGGIESARIFFRGDNLLTFSAFDLWDPELNTRNGFRYPIMKSFSFGVDINF